ncbi:hypothetical protein M1437_02870, partial [Patescibacteria group bacterium]|nr:hypothetical protein [Patescibacteria group bacterium]
ILNPVVASVKTEPDKKLNILFAVLDKNPSTKEPYKLSNKLFPNSTKLSPQALWLPSAFTMTDRDVKYVSVLIKDFLNG